MTLYCCALPDADVAALRAAAADAGHDVIASAGCDTLPTTLTADDRIAVPLEHMVALLQCLRSRRSLRGLDVLVVSPTGAVPAAACDPVDGVAVTYVTSDELQTPPSVDRGGVSYSR